MDKRGHISLNIALGIFGLATAGTIIGISKSRPSKAEFEHVVAQAAKSDSTYQVRISAHIEEKNDLKQEINTNHDSIATLNEEHAKAHNAASWWQSEYSTLKPKYESALDSFNFYKIETDNLACERENLLECLDDWKFANNKLTGEKNTLSTSLANRDWQIAQYQDSLNTAYHRLHIYVVNDRFGPPLRQKDLDKNALPPSMHIDADSKEAVKFYKNLNKLYLANAKSQEE